MKYKLPERSNCLKPETLLKDLRLTAKKLKKDTLTTAEYREHGKHSPETCRRKFLGWDTALETAGLTPRKRGHITAKELMDNLKHVWDKLGFAPTGKDMAKPFSKFPLPTYEYRFGSWRRTLEVFVKYINSVSEERKRKLLRRYDRSPKPGRTLRYPPTVMRYIVLKRDNYKCRLCGSSPATNPGVNLHVDHIKPWSKGGETVEENLQTLCEDCNLGKGSLS